MPSEQMALHRQNTVPERRFDTQARSGRHSPEIGIVTQRMRVGVLFDAAGAQGQAESPLQGGAAHRLRGGGSTLTAVTFSGEEQRGMAVGLPRLAQQFQGALGNRHVAVAVAFAPADVQEHAPGVDVAHLQPESFSQTQAAGIDRGQADAVIKTLHVAEKVADFGSGKDQRQFELGIGADQLQFLRPVALEGLLPKELEGADELGRSLTGDLLDGLEVNTVLADLLNGDPFGRAVVVLAELADTGVAGLFGAGADGQELKVIGEGFQAGVRRGFLYA